MVGDQGANFPSIVWEKIVARVLELGGEFVSDFEFADEAEVIAVSLVCDVDDGALFE